MHSPPSRGGFNFLHLITSAISVVSSTSSSFTLGQYLSPLCPWVNSISTASAAIADFTGAVSSFYTLSSNIHESSYFTARDHTRSAGGLYQSVCLSSTHISIDQSLFGLDKMSALSHTHSGSECTQVADGITYDHHPGKDYCTQLMLYLELLPAGIIRVSSPPAVPQYLGHNSVWTPHLIFSTLYATDHLTVSWCLIFGHSSDWALSSSFSTSYDTPLLQSYDYISHSLAPTYDSTTHYSHHFLTTIQSLHSGAYVLCITLPVHIGSTSCICDLAIIHLSGYSHHDSRVTDIIPHTEYYAVSTAAFLTSVTMLVSVNDRDIGSVHSSDRSDIPPDTILSPPADHAFHGYMNIHYSSSIGSHFLDIFIWFQPWYTPEDCVIHSNLGVFQTSFISADFQSLGVSLHSLGMHIGTGIHHCGGAIDILFLCGLRYWQGRGPKMRLYSVCTCLLRLLDAHYVIGWCYTLELYAAMLNAFLQPQWVQLMQLS